MMTAAYSPSERNLMGQKKDSRNEYNFENFENDEEEKKKLQSNASSYEVENDDINEEVSSADFEEDTENIDSDGSSSENDDDINEIRSDGDEEATKSVESDDSSSEDDEEATNCVKSDNSSSDDDEEEEEATKSESDDSSSEEDNDEAKKSGESDDSSSEEDDIEEKIEKSKDMKFNINLLPEEVLIKIFSYLNQNKLGQIAQVCRRWNALTRSPVLWKTVDVYFFPGYHKSPNDATMGLITNMLPYCAYRIKLNFQFWNNLWSLPLHFEDLSANIQERCPNIEMLLLFDAKLSNSISMVIDLCTNFLKNIKVLVFVCCAFEDSSEKESYGGISKIEILHLINCRHLNKPAFSKMPHLKILRVTFSREINSWFKDDVSFLNRLEILDLRHTSISSSAFLTIRNQGFQLTELYLCWSRITDNDLKFNDSINVFPHLKIICLNRSKVSFEGVHCLMQSCQSLQHVYVNDEICMSESDVACSLLNKFQEKIIKIKSCLYHCKKGDYYL